MSDDAEFEEDAPVFPAGFLEAIGTIAVYDALLDDALNDLITTLIDQTPQ